MNGDPTNILLTHNAWATQNIIEACRHMSYEKFHQKVEMGPGSLHDTLLHIVSAMKAWGNLLAGRDQEPHLSGEHSVDELTHMLEEVSADLIDSANRHPDHEQVTGERGGRSFTFTRAGVLTHVTTHGMHHRAQCLNMLRHLGVEPLPPSSVIEWIMMVDSQSPDAKT